MKTRALNRDQMATIGRSLTRSPLFASLDSTQLELVLEHSQLVALDPGEHLAEEGSRSDCFFVLVQGQIEVILKIGNESVTVATLGPGDVTGETGLLLDEPRGASLLARAPSKALRFDGRVFNSLARKVPDFSLALCRLLAQRVKATSQLAALPEDEEDAAQETAAAESGPDGTAAPSKPAAPKDDVSHLLSRDFCLRHRVAPVRIDDGKLVLGCVDSPTSRVLSAVRELIPALPLSVVRINVPRFERMMARIETTAPVEEGESFGAMGVAFERGEIDLIFQAMVEEGASDLHLSGGQLPRWRIDGEMQIIKGAPMLGPDRVLALLESALPSAYLEEFDQENDVDLAYSVDGCGRFRLNLFRDNNGVCAVARHIPQEILTLEQLNMPAILKKLSGIHKGMVLVTGPTGSGKSTTLAAMIHYINTTRKAHIITLEDPIEFVHQSRESMVNQRDVGNHTKSFSRALKAALREDPDIVLVGEMRDLETISLALETANTGHLVFGTMHTATAISTVDRIIDQFPPEQQNQVRTVLAESLKGVVAQTLCRRLGGGRVAAVEVLVVNSGISNLIRQAKIHQIPSMMQTGRSAGNSVLNDELERLVKEGLVSKDEAIAKAADRRELAAKLGVELKD